MVADLSRQKGLDGDLNAIKQIEFVGKLKNRNNQFVANEAMFVLTTLEKIKEERLKIFSRKRNSLIKDGKF